MQERGPDPALSATLFVRRAWAIVAGVAAVVITADQLTKSWAESHLVDRVVHVVGSLELVLTYNDGVAFGIGSGVAPVLVGVAVIGLLVAILGRHVEITRTSAVAVGLLLGGALGNIADRLFRGHGGAVVDFVNLQWWPVFNVADACVVVGALMFVLVSSRKSS
jgi:signal peptidase II